MRRRRAARGFWLVLAAGWLALSAVAEVAVPQLTARITDQTATLSAQQRGALEQRLAELERSKGSQLAVLIVPTTQPETVEQYALRVAERWRLGRKGVDDGVLLLVAKDDRRLRIEVGYGLEGAIPDAIAKRVIAETITPHFRNGDYYGGILAGVEQLARLIEGEPLPQPAAARGKSPAQTAALFTGLGIVLALGGLLSRPWGVLRAALVSGGGFGALVLLLFGVLAGAAVAALAVFVLSLVIFSGALHTGMRGGRRYGGWSGGGFGGGGFGGGFGGGGGGFGGGGASGGW